MNTNRNAFRVHHPSTTIHERLVVVVVPICDSAVKISSFFETIEIQSNCLPVDAEASLKVAV
jgi:hypothetical protein